MVYEASEQSASGAAGYSVHYGYDLRNLPIFARFASPTGPGITNVYDPLGRLVTATTTMDGTSRSLTSSYDDGSRRTALAGAFGYTTNGLYYYKARIYSPTLGRFLQVDPVGYSDQINLYLYVRSDPLDRTDSSGMCETGSRLGENIFCLTLVDFAQVGGGGERRPAGGASGNSNEWAVPEVEAMYERRAAEGDPYATVALQFGRNNPGPLVASSRREVLDALIVRNGGRVVGGGRAGIIVAGTAGQRAAAMSELRQIRRELAVAYLRATSRDNINVRGRLGPGQIYDIHREVFSRHGLSMRLWAPSQMTGTREEAIATSVVWCPACVDD